METVRNALKKISPSLQRGAEGVVDLRPVNWSDIGGLESVKSEIRQVSIRPIYTVSFYIAFSSNSVSPTLYSSIQILFDFCPIPDFH